MIAEIFFAASFFSATFNIFLIAVELAVLL
jgi:hypothetical protein